MINIEFFNRDSELAEIKNILESKPRLITFIYGPINSGKTALIQKLIEELPKDYVVFYVNLRRKSVIKYEDFIRVLFSVEKDKDIKEILKDILAKVEKAIYVSQGIPINDSLLDTFLRKDSKADVFEFLENYFKEISKTKIPVLIIDELQMIGDLEINGKLIYKLFNFFISLTKELHLCHVFALSSDSLFIERVYNEAMLTGRARYLLVDDFNSETAKKFLENYGISKDEQRIAYDYLEGKPGYLIEAIEAKVRGKDIKEVILTILNIRKGEIQTTLNRVKQLGDQVMIGSHIYKVDYDLLIKTLSKFKERDYINTIEADEITKAYLVKKNILFVDPVKNIIKPQSKIDLLAIREILEEINAASSTI